MEKLTKKKGKDGKLLASDDLESELESCLKSELELELCNISLLCSLVFMLGPNLSSFESKEIPVQQHRAGVMEFSWAIHYVVHRTRELRFSNSKDK